MSVNHASDAIESTSHATIDQDDAVETSHTEDGQVQSNLVPFDEQALAEYNALHRKLERLSILIQQREQTLDERLGQIEPATESLLHSTGELGARTGELEQATLNMQARAEAIELAHQQLAEQTASLARASDQLRAENDRRAADLESQTQHLREHTESLQQHAEQQAADLARLDGRVKELDQMDYQLAEELDGERSRINRIVPQVETLEDDSRRLQRETRALREEDGAIRRFLKRAVWSAVAVVVLLAAGLGALTWGHSQNNQQIAALLSDLGVQQQQIAAVDGVVQSLVGQMQAIPEQLDGLYQKMAASDAQLHQEIAQVDAKLDDEVAQIKQRLFVPDQVLSSGSYDLTKVRSDTWLLAQQPNHYTIQIAGVYGKNALANFMGRHRQLLDLEESAYLHTTFNGRDWFVLLQGSYPSAAQANAAMEALPAELQKNGPYVRRFARIQERVNFRTAQAASE